MTTTRELVDQITAEARKTLAAAKKEYAEDNHEELDAKWTGKSLVMAGSMRVWFLFETPGAWDGFIYMRLTLGGNVMTREPADMEDEV